ncbi:hypothetical protein [Phenylobacterium sp.]|uniref:hypothetical protein n=1 Tax=Phenylobacterium sp. TaxID=1871053 RepID=UPI0028121219|nr:hypothetical protein [Phenylobacterium sp.]
MKPLLLLAAVSMIPLAACTQAKAPRATLDCPATQGDLTRTAKAADGKSCTYVAKNGLEVDLRLVPVTGSAYAALDQIENGLLAQAEIADAKTLPAADTKAAPGSADEAQRIAQQAAADAGGVASADRSGASDEGVDVHVKDDKVVVAEGGGTTRVNLPGIHIVADEEDDSASVRIGPLHLDADGENAVIHIRRDVRLKGEALSRHKRGIRATFISHAEGPQGDRVVGYEAGGPKTGPLTVAIMRSKSDVHDGDDVYGDIKRLVRKNGGV